MNHSNKLFSFEHPNPTDSGVGRSRNSGLWGSGGGTSRDTLGLGTPGGGGRGVDRAKRRV